MPGSGPWLTLATQSPFNAPSLAETLDGGQAFRWDPVADGTWLGQWDTHAVQLRLSATRDLEWRPLTPAVTATMVSEYLALDDQDGLVSDCLPWRSDRHLRRAMTAFPGLRILRQPFGETLLGFLCSATKQIVQIKQMLALLAARHGNPLQKCHHNGDTPTPPSPPDCHLIDDNRFRRLPTWAQLAELSETQLRDCQLGFRARYIKGTAEFLATHPGWLEHTASLPYLEAKEALCRLPGVGAKIADCVALFGLGHLEAFPVDTWMIKAMSRRYGLNGWTPTQVAHFGRVHFGPVAGLAQQYLFAWERAHGDR
jgi:N-glycosylase/DNA lyase